MIEFLAADTSSTASLLVTFTLPMVLILVFMRTSSVPAPEKAGQERCCHARFR